MSSIERRKEPRHPATGLVRLETRTHPPRVVEASLLDVSASGFRAAHADWNLPPGLRVRFSHQEASGVAVVVWTRILGAEATSGFLILTPA